MEPMDATVIGIPLVSLSLEQLYQLRDRVNAEITRRQAPPSSRARCSGRPEQRHNHDSRSGDAEQAGRRRAGRITADQFTALLEHENALARRQETGMMRNSCSV